MFSNDLFSGHTFVNSRSENGLLCLAMLEAIKNLLKCLLPATSLGCRNYSSPHQINTKSLVLPLLELEVKLTQHTSYS
jgi:hypothetical protein